MDHPVGLKMTHPCLPRGSWGVFPKVAAYLPLAKFSAGEVIPPALPFHSMLLSPGSKRRPEEGEGVNPMCFDHTCTRAAISVEPAGHISMVGFSQVHHGSHHTAGP